jgi:thioesterase domain-containing protein
MVSARQLARWRRLAPRTIRWCNAYGTTESVITSTVYEPESDELPATVPIGRPLPGTQVSVLDARGQPVVDGEPGELYIGGDKLARGYLNELQLTATHFVRDPRSAGADARMCRTGDWVKRRADGNLEFLGRRDHQVNLRGFRIELGEIESALIALPQVSEAVVVAHGEPGANKRLVAYIVPTVESEHAGDRQVMWSVGEFRQLLGQKLPSYMIPAVFVTMDALPRNSNGKVNRHALAEPDTYRPDLEDSFIPPADSLEDKLAAIWRDVLGLDSVGVEDNFFDLGGHSLHAARVISALNRLSRQKLQLRALHESPTIRKLANRLRQMEPLATPSSLAALQPGGSRPPLFLVHGAGGGMLWGYSNLARHLGSDQPVYCFHSRGLDGLQEHSSIDEMARQYVSDLRAFSPTGPYRLGGYCFGGEVAFEMAQQLEAQGARVELLVFFNAMPPNSPFENPRFTVGLVVPFIQNAWCWLRHFFRWPAGARQDFFRRKFRSLTRRITRLLRVGEGTARLAETSERIDLSPFAEEQRRLWDTHLRASSHYHPRPYDGDVLVFRTSIYPFFCTFDPTFGWRDFVKGRLTLKVVPGAHESILDEPYVREVARLLSTHLSGVQSQREKAGEWLVPAAEAA